VRSALTFGNETSLEGSTGCNRYFAGLQLSGTTIHVGNTGSTKMACPSAGMDQETRFLVALEAPRAYRLNSNANQLWLLGENGSELAHFARIGGAAGSTGRTSGGTELSQVSFFRMWVCLADGKSPVQTVIATYPPMLDQPPSFMPSAMVCKL
jgi:hypothetical protein